MILTKTGRGYLPVIILFFLIALNPVLSFSQTLSLDSRLDQNEIWLGESVGLSIILQGSEQSFAPKLLIPGVKIDDLGGSKRSSESLTSINGKVSRVVNYTYIYSFILAPGKAGEFIIPSVSAEIEGMHLQTSQLSIIVKQPELSEDYHLLLGTETDNLFVSEEFSLNLSFLFNASIRELSVRIPALEGFDYKSIDPAGNGEKYQIEINGKPFIFYRNDQHYKGVEYAGISAGLTVKINSKGKIDFGSSTAFFEAVSGYENVQDFFGRVQQQPVYRRIVIPANPKTLNIKPFPGKGKPDNFTGLSGHLSAESSALPQKVHIGDPITLEIKLRGLNNPDVDIPELKSLLGGNFDLPDFRSYDKVDGNSKTITQTIRVKNPDTTEIPPFHFSYFDPDSEEYKTVATKAIPLELMETDIVTSLDLEGGSMEEESGLGKILVEKKKEGIYYNYSGQKVLEKRKPINRELLSSILIWGLVILPPGTFIVLIFLTTLLPQLRKKVILNRDKKAAFKYMTKRIKSMRNISSIEFLRTSNREISTFIRTYRIDCSNSALRENLTLMNNKLYGSSSDDNENTKPLVEAVLESFKQEGVV